MFQKTSSSLTIRSLEGPTAANTPMELADPLKIGSKTTPDLEKEQPSPSSRPSSPSTSQSTVSNRLVSLYRPPAHRRTRTHSNSLSRRTSGQTTELQNELRRHVSLHGVATNCGSEGVMEARKRLDMGGEKGHEEVVIIDWLPNDPNVCLIKLYDTYSHLLIRYVLVSTPSTTLLQESISFSQPRISLVSSRHPTLPPVLSSVLGVCHTSKYQGKSGSCQSHYQ